MADIYMSNSWSLQDAKAKFSELVNSCVAEGAQTVTKHGKPTVVVLPWEAYQELKKRKGSLRSFLAAAPRAVLDIGRSDEPERELVL
jgi:prevent-host-death family protein